MQSFHLNKNGLADVVLQFGFLTHEIEDGKKLFFHMTEVEEGIELQPGDVVQFVIVHNQRNGKYSACNIRRIVK